MVAVEASRSPATRSSRLERGATVCFLTAFLLPVVLALTAAAFARGVPEFGAPRGPGPRGYDSCDNPVLANTPTLSGYPFTCGLQRVLPNRPVDAADAEEDADPTELQALEVYAYIQPNGSWCWSNAGLITNRRTGESVLVDTLTDERLTQAMLDAMAPVLATNPLKLLVHTHGDIDHVLGNALVADNVSQVLMSEGAALAVAKMKPAASAGATYRALHLLWHVVAQPSSHSLRPWTVWLLRSLGAGWPRERVMQVLGVARAVQFFAPFQLDRSRFHGEYLREEQATVFTGGRTQVVLGGLPIDIIELPPAHSAGDTVVVVPSARTAFVGDLLFLGTSPIMWHGPARNVLAALDVLEQLDVDTFIPGHGPVTDVSTVRLLKAYWKFVQRAAGACAYAGTPKLQCGRNAIGFLDKQEDLPFKDWGDKERMLVNVWVEMSHWEGSPHDGNDVNFTVSTPEKFALLGVMGEYLIEQQLAFQQSEGQHEGEHHTCAGTCDGTCDH